MTARKILMTALILVLSVGSGQADLTVSQQVYPGQIWPMSSGNEPAFGRVSLKVVGDSLPGTVPLDVVLAIDSSASMKETDPTEMRLDAARIFVMKMDPARDRVGIVSWDDGVDFSIPPTENFPWFWRLSGRWTASAERTWIAASKRRSTF